jgi:hypothetical protein
MAVGSLPMVDPQAAIRAQLQGFAEVPAWPQLPKRSPKELVHVQSLSGLPGITTSPAGLVVFALSPEDLSEAHEVLRTENQENRLERAAFKADEAAGFFAFLDPANRKFFANVQAVKGQTLGPVSLALSLQDDNGKPLLSSRGAMEVLTEYLLMHCRWQLKELSVLGKPVILFLDEPSLNGKFKPEEYGLGWDDIQGMFRTILEPLQEEEALTGIHCCGPGPWTWAYQTPVEFFHFDAFQYLDDLLQDPSGLKEYLRKGGNLVWGLVPTSMTHGNFVDPAELVDKWVWASEELAKKGLAREVLQGRSFFSTACGLGGSTLSVSEEAVRCLSATVSLWKTIAIQP